MRTGRREFLSSLLALSLLTGARANGRAKTAALRRALARGRFISYQPTGITVLNGKLTDTNDDGIREDLRVLRPWFDSLVTYSSLNGADRVADVAATLGYRALILGVWDFGNDEEVQNALASARRNPNLVVGCSLGNETILSKRGSWSDVAKRLK